ncbi:ParA family protein [Jatrophihabitans lederbergiae]|uniref:ParA family protein n=1 Tax=Jatrophihabitans lederbergiae TaxID=3075547 RepID=A0ABU2JGK9_9ACTN|nr:ParA family protein [Jatrophihabitans sp. DSM 44399]MDT0264132.1 ParA family protein [Jatrophihabitans sp. DSM 44399]
MDILSLFSEKGGVGKTTATVRLARALASRGLNIGVVDLDPRSTATICLGVEVRRGEHVGAILGTDDVAGAAQDLAHSTPWHPTSPSFPVTATSLPSREHLRNTTTCACATRSPAGTATSC